MVTALPITSVDVADIPRGMDLLDRQALNKGTAFTRGGAHGIWPARASSAASRDA